MRLNASSSGKLPPAEEFLWRAPRVFSSQSLLSCSRLGCETGVLDGKACLMLDAGEHLEFLASPERIHDLGRSFQCLGNAV